MSGRRLSFQASTQARMSFSNGLDVQAKIELGLVGGDPFGRDQLQRRDFVIAVGRAEMLDLPRPAP